MLIDDYKYIATRLQEIIIQEGRTPCPSCNMIGWVMCSDEIGGMYYVECRTCKNPFGRTPPPAYDPYCC